MRAVGADPTTAPAESSPWHRLDRATSHLDPPLAVLDLAALQANAADLVRRAAGKPIRLASKSVRCRTVLRPDARAARVRRESSATRCPRRSGWPRGVIDDSSSATRPSTGRRFAGWRRTTQLASRVTLMVDGIEQLDFIDAVVAPAAPTGAPALPRSGRLAARPLGGRIHLGTRRSPVHSPAEAGRARRGDRRPARASPSSA